MKEDINYTEKWELDALHILSNPPAIPDEVDILALYLSAIKWDKSTDLNAKINLLKINGLFNNPFWKAEQEKWLSGNRLF